MYDYFKGILSEKSPTHAVIECGGVGYFLEIPLSTAEKLPALSATVTLKTHFHVNEGEYRLFGFFSEDERKLFRSLINISRIGPKLGLAVLSAFSVEKFVQAINLGNVALIASVPGLGKKSAERLIVELKDKTSGLLGSEMTFLPHDIFGEAQNALLTLGYKQQEMQTVLTMLQSGTYNTSEEIVKAAIKLLYKKGK